MLREIEPQKGVDKSIEAKRAAQRQQRTRAKEKRLAEQAALAREVGREPVTHQKLNRKTKKLNIGEVPHVGNPQHSRFDRSYHDDSIQTYGSGRDDR